MSNNTTKVAKFKGVESGHETVSNYDMTTSSVVGYVRTSGWLEIELPPLAADEIVRNQLDKLDEAEAAVRVKFQERLDAIDAERANLRALTYVPEVQPWKEQDVMTPLRRLRSRGATASE